MRTEAATTTEGSHVREVVGVFVSADALDAAVDHLSAAGFHRSSISVLGTDDKVKGKIAHHYRRVTEIEDDECAPRAAFVSRRVRLAGEMTTVVIPLYIGGLLGAAAVVASGGALAVAIAGLILGSATGASIGGLLADAVAQHHARRIEEQLAQGGLVLWVRVLDQQSQQRALAVLERAGARHLHVHELRVRPARGLQPV